MNRMIHGVAGFLKHSLLLCLCAVLLCSCACAETIIDLGLPEGGDGMGYEATLPDGRLVFSGCNSEAGNSMNSKARLLCLNPDGTTSWDYIYPQEGCCSFFYEKNEVYCSMCLQMGTQITARERLTCQRNRRLSI